MSDRIKNIALTVTMAVFFLTMLLINILKPDTDYSDSERRVLAKKPALSVKALETGAFMKEFETYTLDQFVCRDTYRSIKTISELYLFQKKECNQYYIADGYIAKMEYPFSKAMQDHVVERFDYINDTYLSPAGIKPYFAMVPDKGYFLAKENGYLSLDYDAFEQSLSERLPYMRFIDIKSMLTIEDYYRTDTHWRQEKISGVAIKIAETMGADIETSYEIKTLAAPFYGVYYHQLALPCKPDSLSYVTNETIESCTVSILDTGKPVLSDVYDFKKASAKDPYDLFLSGATALITIENPSAATDKQLILFRDSFGSSLAPYFIEGYQKITLVDIRYVQSAFLSAFLDFENADVLFLFSTLLLNNSLALK